MLLGDGDVTLTLAADSGGRIAGLRIGELELLGRGGPGVHQWGCFPMAPFAGRVRHGRLRWNGRVHQLPLNDPPNAIHGVAVDRPWQVLHADRRTASLRCSFDSRWPWAGHALSSIALEDGGLRVELQVVAEREPMPAWCGWHPWFARELARGEPVRLTAPSPTMLRRDGGGLTTAEEVPAGDGGWDDCFIDVRWPVDPVWPGALRVSMQADHPYAVLFDGEPAAICLEPQTAPPDALALGRHAVVTPDSPLVLRMEWRWSQD